MWLTGRAVGLLAVGAVSFLVAAMAGIPALLYISGLCVGLVGAAVLLSLLARPRLEVTRIVEPSIVEPEELAEVVMSMTVKSSVPVVARTWRDRLPSTLFGASADTVPPTGDGHARLSYHVKGRRRGSHEIGPVTVVVGDAFGLVERSLSDEQIHRLIVLPRRRPLEPRVGPAGAIGGTTRMRRTSGLGQDDVIARQYLPGDALKRWHWKATAHHGEPMVRQEESELRPRVLVYLDPDPRVHDQAGFEWSVSAAASVITHYGDRGYDVDLVSGAVSMSLDAGHGLQDALVTLALLELNVEEEIGRPPECTAFIMTGRLDEAAARRLVSTIPSRDAVAFVAWGTSDAANEVLVRAGWHAVVRDDAADVTVAWSEATGAPVS